jgi:hypothetical protein
MDEGNLSNPRRCTARSKQSQGRCKRWAITGGTVCPIHGGSAPQVRRSAEQRLADLVDPAITALTELVESSNIDAIRLAAIKDVLDRAGFKPRERIEQSGKVVIEVVYGDDSQGSFAPLALSPATDQD